MPSLDVVSNYKMPRPSITNPASKALVEKYATLAEQGVPSKAYTLPLYSTGTLPGIVVVSDGVGYVKFAKGSRISFFTYAKNSQIPTGLPTPAATEIATDYHTNLTEPSKTPMNMDFAIELLQFVFINPRIRFANVPPTNDEMLNRAFNGQIPLVDVGSVMTPPQYQNPQNLEVPWDSKLRQALLISMGWGDGRSLDPLGFVDTMHDGTARSYLTAAGQPAQGNGLYQPEGHLWLGTSLGSDSKFQMQAELAQDVVFIIQGATWPGDETATFPTHVLIDVRAYLLGLGMIPLGMNA